MQYRDSSVRNPEFRELGWINEWASGRLGIWASGHLVHGTGKLSSYYCDCALPRVFPKPTYLCWTVGDMLEFRENIPSSGRFAAVF